MGCPRFTAAQARRALTKIRKRKLPHAHLTLRMLVQGMNVEREHRDIGSCHSPTMAARIALAHLRERPDYYRRLKRFVEK